MFVSFYRHPITPLSVSQVLNSHSHVMYILSILLAKYTEIKVSLKVTQDYGLNENLRRQKSGD